MLVLKGLVSLLRLLNFSFFGVGGWGKTWITVMLNGLPWKGTETILSFLRLQPSIAFPTPVDSEGYSISSKDFLPTVVDIMVS